MEEPAEDMNRLVDDAQEEMDKDEEKEDFEMHMVETLGMDRLVSSGSEIDLWGGVNLEEGAL